MKKGVIKTLAVVMSCLTLSLSLFQVYSVPVQASAVSISLPRCIDIILTNQGIVANQTSLSSIGDVLVDTLDTSMKGYITYCKENNLDWKDKTSYTLWKENTNIVNALLDAIIKNRQNKGDDGSLTDTDIVDVLVEPTGGTNTVIPKSIQQPIVDAYKSWWEDCGGYYNVWIPSYKELVGYCYNTTVYDNLEYLTSKHDFIYVFDLYVGTSSKGNRFAFVDLDAKDCFVYNGVNSSYGFFTTLYNDWQSASFCFYYAEQDGTSVNNLRTFEFSDLTTYVSKGTIEYIYYINNLGTNGGYTSGYHGLISDKGEYVKVWKSLDAFKSYSVGVQNVYYSPNYSTTVNNDMTVTTDYITTYANQYSYSSVQQQIDNSSEVTEETVNSIVGSTITNITNNYYYTSPSDGTTSGGDSGDGSDDGNGLFDGLLGSLGEVLGNLIGLLDDLVAMALNALTSGLNIIVSGIRSVLTLFSTFSDDIAGLNGALVEFFPYVPEEWFTLIGSAVTLIVTLIVIGFLRR